MKNCIKHNIIFKIIQNNEYQGVVFFPIPEKPYLS